MKDRAKQVLETVEVRIKWTKQSITEYMESIQYTTKYITEMDATQVDNCMRMIGELQSLSSKQSRLAELNEQCKQLHQQKAALEFILKED